MKVDLLALPVKILLVTLSAVCCLAQQLAAQQAAVFEIEFTNAGLVPPHWQLKLNPDGSGQFDAEGGQPSKQDKNQIFAGDVHRTVQLSPELTARIFATARERRFFFNFPARAT